MTTSSEPLYTVALFDYGMTPVSSKINVERTAEGYAIYAWNDFEEQPPQKISSLSINSTWKDVAQSLLSLEEGRIDGDAIEHVKVSGIGGLRAECLKYAWAEESSSKHSFDCHELLEWLLSLEEDTIDYLESNFDISSEAEIFKVLLDLQDVLFTKEVTNLFDVLIEENLHGEKLFIEKLDGLASSELVSQMKKRKVQEQGILDRFNDQIEPLLAKFSDSRGRAAFSPPSERAVVSRFLHAYILEHEAMPVGQHVVEVTWMNKKVGPGKVDFGD